MTHYEPQTEFERLVLERLTTIEARTQRAEAASVAAANATIEIRQAVDALREESRILSDAALGARLAAEESERRAIAIEERSAGNGRLQRSETPTHPELPRYSSGPPQEPDA